MSGLVQQSVSETAGEDLPANVTTTGVVTVGGTASGTIGRGVDRDWFAVELEAGRTYIIDLRGSPTGDGTLSDPYLNGIHDAEGNYISGTANDDGGEGTNSRVTFEPTESGAYYIAAGAYSFGQGSYEVAVTDTAPSSAPPPRATLRKRRSSGSRATRSHLRRTRTGAGHASRWARSQRRIRKARR